MKPTREPHPDGDRRPVAPPETVDLDTAVLRGLKEHLKAVHFSPLMPSSERGQPWSLRDKVLIPALVGLLATSAQAQLLPTRETHIVLSQQDLGMIRGTVTNQVHGKPAGTTASWSNPTSGNSGSIKLIEKLARKNQQCEHIEYTVRSGAGLHRALSFHQ